MGEYDFTYIIPDNFKKNTVQLLRQNQKNDVAQAFQGIEFEYEDLGWAYYAGLRGDNWNKKAIDITFEGAEKDINLLQANNEMIFDVVGKALKPTISGFLVKNIFYLVSDDDLEVGDNWNKKAIDITFEGAEKDINLLQANNEMIFDVVGKALKPTISGFLVKNIFYLVSDDDLEVELPEEQGETFEILSRDIYDALAKDEPALVLDRLHTYSSKYLRGICAKHGISTDDSSGDIYPLHSLAGILTKYYKANNVFQSEFIKQALKMSISSFEKYNKIRNDQSYAHDNDVLNNIESAYVVRIITATLTLIHEIENQ